MPVYLTLAEVVAIHGLLLERHGGASGLRDPGALEAALFRPQTGYYRDVIEEAAALFESLIANHAFVDGNKRVAFAVTDVFLRLNGFTLEVSSDEAFTFLTELFTRGAPRFEDVEPWLRQLAKSR